MSPTRTLSLLAQALRPSRVLAGDTLDPMARATAQRCATANLLNTPRAREDRRRRARQTDDRRTLTYTVRDRDTETLVAMRATPDAALDLLTRQGLTTREALDTLAATRGNALLRAGALTVEVGR